MPASAAGPAAAREAVHAVGDEAAMVRLGEALAAALPRRAVVTLSGDLGAGKSVLARAMLRAFGHEGAVPSPTYAVVESYAVAGRRIAHLDLYRLLDPGELYDIGFDDVVAGHEVLLIEWPEKGVGMLPVADVAVRIEHAAGDVRRVSVRSGTSRPEELPGNRLDKSSGSSML